MLICAYFVLAAYVWTALAVLVCIKYSSLGRRPGVEQSCGVHPSFHSGCWCLPPEQDNKKNEMGNPK